MFLSDQMRRPFQQAMLLAALLLLSLLESATVLVRDLVPAADLAALPPLEHAAIALGSFGLLALGFAALARIRKPAATSSGQQGMRRSIAAGFMLFALPAGLSAIASHYISPLTVAAVETLALLFTRLLAPYLTEISVPRKSSGHGLAGPGSEPAYGMLPSLIVFGGVLLVFPVFVPTSYTAALGLAAAFAGAISIGAGNCLLTGVQAQPLSLTTVSLSAALPLAALSLLLEEPRLHRSMLNLSTALLFAAELLALALLFRLRRALSAPALATRAAWSLLLPILVEAAVLSFPISARNAIGLALMASGSAVLLLPDKASLAGPGLTLR